MSGTLISWSLRNRNGPNAPRRVLAGSELIVNALTPPSFHLGHDERMWCDVELFHILKLDRNVRFFFSLCLGRFLDHQDRVRRLDQ
jgi:hypothetical protein